MKLSAHVSRSRHGIFYFRWPVPNDIELRRTVRVSLQTRCPNQAGLLARHLASCGQDLSARLSKGSMRYEDIRNHVQKMLQAELARRLRVLKDQGPERFASTVASDNARALLAEGSEVYWGTIGRELQGEDLKRFSVESGLPFDDVLSERSRILPVIHRGLLAMLAEFDVRKAELEAIDIGAFPHQVPVIPKVMPEAEEASRTLAEVVDLFINEHVRVGVWVERTRSKQEATLGVLIELLGGETPMASITKKQAQDVKAVLLTIPANKNKNPKTRDLSLRDAAKVPGVEPMSPTTLNGYLGAFHTFMEGLSL